MDVLEGWRPSPFRAFFFFFFIILNRRFAMMLKLSVSVQLGISTTLIRNCHGNTIFACRLYRISTFCGIILLSLPRLLRISKFFQSSVCLVNFSSVRFILWPSEKYSPNWRIQDGGLNQSVNQFFFVHYLQNFKVHISIPV